MPISMDQWRASVGSNNAARARVFSKMKCSSHKCSSPSFLSQLLTYILTFISSIKRSATDKGVCICMYVCMNVSMLCMYVCMCGRKQTIFH